MIRITTFAGRRVAVFGLARSGLAAARSLLVGGAEVACWDDGARGRDAAAAEGLPLADLREADWIGFSALVLTPGVPLTHPEPHWTVKRAKSAGVEVIGDTELFFRELATLGQTRPRVIGITGTNGKSTTTALTAHLLRHAGKRVAMGGNIGEAVLGLSPFAETDVYVLELSSYQIDLTPGAACDVGILLNLSPDHLDRHGSMERYAEVKGRLVANAETAIVGLDDSLCWQIAINRLERSNERRTIGVHVAYDPTRASSFDPIKSAPHLLSPDLKRFRNLGGDLVVFTGADWILRHDETILPDDGDLLATLGGIDTLRGPHNGQNASAAYCACESLGIDAKTLEEGLESYPGLAHRMEILGSIGACTYVNDSKATNADSTAKALNSFAAGIHWILGGKSKDGGIESLEPYFHNVSHAYLIGDAAEQFAETLAKHPAITLHRCGTLARAVEEAAHTAGGRPATVLLSPACASFDQFKDFEDRGDQFRALVAKLPGFVPYGSV